MIELHIGQWRLGLMFLCVVIFQNSFGTLCAQPPRTEQRNSLLTGRLVAPVDLTGYWVSVVTEDWRYRMVTPASGDYESIPMTPEARKLADIWDPAKDEASGDLCRSYGAPALSRVPGHIRLTWQDDQTLRLETDSGMQARLFHFGNWTSTNRTSSRQGDSVAQWRISRTGDPESLGTKGSDASSGFLTVTTTGLKPGYLRKNGVPYGQSASILEYYELVTEPGDILWMVVTTIVTDPEYLREPFIVSSNFKRQADDSGWKPTACSARW